MLLPELQTMASSLGVQSTARMRKGELIAAIQELQGDGRVPGPRADAARNGASESAAARNGASESAAPAEERAPRAERPVQVAAAEAPRSEVRAEVRESDRRDDGDVAPESNGRARRASRAAGPPEPRIDARGDSASDAPERERGESRQRSERSQSGERNDRQGGERNERQGGDRQGSDRAQYERGNDRGQGERSQNDRGQGDRD